MKLKDPQATAARRTDGALVGWEIRRAKSAMNSDRVGRIIEAAKMRARDEPEPLRPQPRWNLRTHRRVTTADGAIGALCKVRGLQIAFALAHDEPTCARCVDLLAAIEGDQKPRLPS